MSFDHNTRQGFVAAAGEVACARLEQKYPENCPWLRDAENAAEQDAAEQDSGYWPITPPPPPPPNAMPNAMPNALPNPVGRPTRETTIPDDSEARKRYPMATGLLDYFPDALAAVANISYEANEKHNKGEAMHWSRKSPDHADTIVRHLARRGTVDTDGKLHSAKVAWRALALLQEELNPGSMPK